MGVAHRFDKALASPWRRRSMCLLIAGEPAPAALRDISGSGAFLETNARPPLGAMVTLRHPDAGSIDGVVRATGATGIEIVFDCNEASVAFALAAIVADMSRTPL